MTQRELTDSLVHQHRELHVEQHTAYACVVDRHAAWLTHDERLDTLVFIADSLRATMASVCRERYDAT